MFLFSYHSWSSDFFCGGRVVFLQGGNTAGIPLENPNLAGSAMSEGRDPLADFKDKSDTTDSENTLRDFEKKLAQKEKNLTERYKDYPRGVEKVKTFFREQREALQKVREQLALLQAQYEGNKQEAGKPVSDLLKPFFDSTLASTTKLQNGIDQSLEAMNKSIADAVAQAAAVVAENPSLTQSGVCEQYSDAVKKIAMEKLGGADSAKKLALNWQEPLATAATSALRGTLVSGLTLESLASAGVQPGMVFYVASKEKYAADGVAINPGTADTLAKKNDTDRHWFTALPGGLFADNLGTKPRSLQEMQGSVGNRVVVNIHDPYQSLRGKVA